MDRSVFCSPLGNNFSVEIRHKATISVAFYFFKHRIKIHGVNSKPSSPKTGLLKSLQMSIKGSDLKLQFSTFLLSDQMVMIAHDKKNTINFSSENTIISALAEPAGMLSMLHPCMHSKYLINIENTESTHGEVSVSLQCRFHYIN